MMSGQVVQSSAPHPWVTKPVGPFAAGSKGHSCGYQQPRAAMNMATVHCSCCSVCCAPSSLCPRAYVTATVCCHVSASFLGGGSCLLVFLLRVFLQVSSSQFIQCGQYSGLVTVSTCSTPPPKVCCPPTCAVANLYVRVVARHWARIVIHALQHGPHYTVRQWTGCPAPLHRCRHGVALWLCPVASPASPRASAEVVPVPNAVDGAGGVVETGGDQPILILSCGTVGTSIRGLKGR